MGARFALFLFVGCGTVGADPSPSPACAIEAGPIDCTSNDCQAFEDGGHDDAGHTISIGDVTRGKCASGNTCNVWIDASAKYGVCR